MKSKGWFIKKIGASRFNIGWPDYYAYHAAHGHRWIEAKAPGGKLRASQSKLFAEMTSLGDKVYVLEGPETYGRLFKEPNWRQYRR